tara:strand:- start:2389 stop:2733 length:345 start_codon:yes stop_codon:yes gene_type:complete
MEKFDPYDDEELDGFSDEEKDIIRRSSMVNTYRLIVSNYDFSIFPDTMFWLLTNYKDQNVLEILLEYFESTEEYEICAELYNIQLELDKVIANRRKKREGQIKYLIEPTKNDEP